MVVFGQSGYIRAKMVVFVKKVVVFGKKVIVFLQGCCIWAKWLYSSKSGCICAEVVVFGKKVIVFLQGGCIRAKIVVF